MTRKTYIEYREIKDVVGVFHIQVKGFKRDCLCDDNECEHRVLDGFLDTYFTIDFPGTSIDINKAHDRFEEYIKYWDIPKGHASFYMVACHMRHPLLKERSEESILREFEADIKNALNAVRIHRQDNEAKRAAYEDMDNFMKTVEKVTRESLITDKLIHKI